MSVVLPENVRTNVLRMPPARLETPHDRADVPLPWSGIVPVVDDPAFNHELNVLSSRLKPPNAISSKRLFGEYAVDEAALSLMSDSVLESVLLLLLLMDRTSVLYSISSLKLQVRRCMTPASNGAACNSFRFPLLRAKLLWSSPRH